MLKYQYWCAQLDMQMTKEKVLNDMAMSSGFSGSYIDKTTLINWTLPGELLSECGFTAFHPYFISTIFEW